MKSAAENIPFGFVNLINNHLMIISCSKTDPGVGVSAVTAWFWACSKSDLGADIPVVITKTSLKCLLSELAWSNRRDDTMWIRTRSIPNQLSVLCYQLTQVLGVCLILPVPKELYATRSVTPLPQLQDLRGAYWLAAPSGSDFSDFHPKQKLCSNNFALE